jgi:2-polyprenyl-3-methyl-5-hydroxy-6-metoxy-1,4-benzoquinol methylase
MYNSGMKRESDTSPYDQIASEYDDLFGDQNPYYQSVNRCERELFEKWINRSNNHQRAMDIGCGTGFHTKWLVDYGFNSTGIDKSKEMVRLAETKSRAWAGVSDFIVLDVDDLEQMPENYYRVILCLGSTLNHFEDWKAVAKLISKRLVVGGVFLFSYDNMDGIDVIARVMLRQFAGYTDSYIREILFGRVKARISGGSFNNHWRVRANGKEIEVPLKYEHTKKWRRFLNEAGLHLCEVQGTHVFDCFDNGLLKASAGINVTGKQTSGRSFGKYLQRVDRILARRLHHVAAHVVGIAIKQSP